MAFSDLSWVSSKSTKNRGRFDRYDAKMIRIKFDGEIVCKKTFLDKIYK